MASTGRANPRLKGSALERRWTIFSFEREAVWTSRTGAWHDYRRLAPPAPNAETNALIRQWGRQRRLHRIGA